MNHLISPSDQTCFLRRVFEWQRDLQYLRCIAIKWGAHFASWLGASSLCDVKNRAAFKSANAHLAQQDLSVRINWLVRSHLRFQRPPFALFSMMPWNTVQSLQALCSVQLTWSNDRAELKGPLAAIRRMISTGRVSNRWRFGEAKDSLDMVRWISWCCRTKTRIYISTQAVSAARSCRLLVDSGEKMARPRPPQVAAPFRQPCNSASVFRGQE